MEFCLNLEESQNKFPHIVKVQNLLLDGQVCLKFYVKLKTTEEKKIKIKISYMLECEKSIACTKEDMVAIEAVNPFNTEVKYLSSLLEDISKCYVGEDFAVMPILKCVSPWPIVIEDTALEFVCLKY